VLNRQVIGFNHVDVFAISTEEAPDGVPMAFLRFRGSNEAGEDIMSVEVPIPPDLAIKVGESLIECGKGVGGSGLDVVRSMAEAEQVAAESEAASRLIVPR